MVKGNFPALLTSFVGRQMELERIKRLFEETRLLTLSGPGGSGKTRLALEAAVQLAPQFEGGTWLVELAALTSPHLVAPQIAQTLEIAENPDQDLLATLVAALKPRRLLLVLDNCEHLLDACAILSERLLKECPQLFILATSRESLRVTGETVLNVPPLALPEPTALAALNLEELAQTEAVQLFVQRSRAAQPDFELTEQNREAVVDLCRQLDRLPLALELAAVRLGNLSVIQLAARLESSLGARFRLLNQGSRGAQPRHQSLTALLEWSYKRLPEREQVALRRVAIFRGGFPLAGAEVVCPGGYSMPEGQGKLEASDLFELLTELSRKSLLQPDPIAADQAEPRYRLLETIRQYGVEKAVQAGEREQLQQSHLEWCIAFAENAAAFLQGPEQTIWLKRVEQEQANCRAALEWALENDRLEEALRLSGALWPFWQARSYFEEGRHWLKESLDRNQSRAVSLAVRAKALEGAGVLFSLFDYPTSLAYHTENLQVRRALNDRPGLAAGLKDSAWLALHYNDFARAKSLGKESLEVAHGLGDRAGEAAALFVVALAAFFEGEIEVAGRLSRECLEIWRELGDSGSVASALHLQGKIALARRDLEGARQALLGSLELNRQLANPLGAANNVLELMQLGLAQDEQPHGLRYTARLLGWSASFEAALGAKMPPLARQSFDTSLAECRSRLGEVAFQAGWEEGLHMSLEEALDLAGTGGKSPMATKKGLGQNQLTPRETEVLRLVAAGLTNAQAAAKLSVTPRTINAHLTSIYAKLAVVSRATAIRYALEHDLL